MPPPILILLFHSNANMEIQFQFNKKISRSNPINHTFVVPNYRLCKLQLFSRQVPPDAILSGKISQRLLSLDFMRGFIMVLLALESYGPV
jgi:hypothetical protein